MELPRFQNEKDQTRFELLVLERILQLIYRLRPQGKRTNVKRSVKRTLTAMANEFDAPDEMRLPVAMLMQRHLELVEASTMKGIKMEEIINLAIACVAGEFDESSTLPDDATVDTQSQKAWPHEEKAIRQFEEATAAIGDVTRKESYKWLSEQGLELPSFETWCRYIRNALR
jgi:hypothetical protein